MKIKLLVLLAVSGLHVSAYANECLNKMLPDFQADNVSIINVSKSGKVTISPSDSDGGSNQNCHTTKTELEQFVTKNFRAQAKINGMDIIESWGYLSINKHVIYDALKELLSDPFYKEDNRILSYNLISIINSSIVCYSTRAASDIGAHPSDDSYYTCQNINNDKPYKITDFFDEKELLDKLLANKDLRKIIIKDPKTLSSIKSLTDLNDLTNDMVSNEESSEDDKYNLECMSDSFNPDIVGFTLTNLNSDKTVNVSYQLTFYGPSTSRSMCTGGGAFDTVELTNLHPKIEVTQLLNADNLYSASNKNNLIQPIDK